MTIYELMTCHMKSTPFKKEREDRSKGEEGSDRIHAIGKIAGRHLFLFLSSRSSEVDQFDFRGHSAFLLS